MGNAKSRYEETKWSEASGGLAGPAETVDGAAPTSGYVQLTINQTIGVVQTLQSLPVVRNIVHHRDYEVMDTNDTSKILFRTKPVDDLEMGFDFLREDTKVCLRMESSPSNRTWTILQVGTPVFEGQRPQPKPSEKMGEDLFRKAIVQFGKDNQHMAEVYMFVNDNAEDELDKPTIHVERCVPPNLTGKVMDQWHFQTYKTPQDATLSGYWKRDALCVPGREKIVMDVAKDSDLALHVILAVIAIIERSSLKAEYTG